MKETESCLVRSRLKGETLCMTAKPEESVWIAERLNRCVRLEKLIEEIGVSAKEIRCDTIIEMILKADIIKNIN